MTTLKGAYQRFVTSVIRFWKGENTEQTTENELAGTSPLVKVTKEDPTEFESSVDPAFSTLLTSDPFGPLISQARTSKERPKTLCIDSDLLTSSSRNYPWTPSPSTPQRDLLNPELKKLTEKPKLKKSPTFLKLSPSLFRKPTRSTQSSQNIQQTHSPSRHRSGTGTIVRSFSSISKRFDGTLRKRTRTEAVRARKKAMDEIQTGKDKTMSAEPFFARLRDYNTYYEDKTSLQLKWKQDKFGNHLIDGMLNIYWGLKKSIRLQTADSDVRIRPTSQYNPSALVVRPQNEKITNTTINESVDIVLKEQTLSGTLLRKKLESAKEQSKIDEEQIINIENGILGDTRQRTCDRRRMAIRLKDGGEKIRISLDNSSGSPLRQKSVILRKKRSNRSSRKTFSINGHMYNYETSVFTPEYGSVTNVRVTSKTSCDDVIKHLLNKFRIENSPDEFSLYLVKETQEQRELARDEYPLVSRILSGPNEQVCKLYVMDRYMHQDITPDVAQYIKLDMNILQMFVKKFTEEQEREEDKMRKRFELYRKMLLKRIEEHENN